jgi:hypothetical protein
MGAGDGGRGEAAAAGLGGAVLGFGAGALADVVLDTWPVLAIGGAVVGGANGVISGLRGIYDWRRPQGVLGFVLDSTWSLLMTATALFSNAVGLLTKDSGYVPELSQRRSVHVYRRGFAPRKGFATTLGNVVGGAADIERESRRHLIEDHEVVHAWQARWLGPFYPFAYVGWSALAALYGLVMWATRHRDRSIGDVVQTYAYYSNPVEWWAYSRAGHWRPSSMVDGCGWRRPMVRPHASVIARTRAK